MQRYLFHSRALHLSMECLPVIKKSGKVVISDRIQTNAAFLHQTLPVNSQIFPVLRHMWLYCCPLTVVAHVMLPGLALYPWM